jgi:hypothetical protein
VIENEQTRDRFEDVVALAQEATGDEAPRYQEVSRLLYLEHLIEKRLLRKLTPHNPGLPHHTLLAKDHDVGHPEQRLAYKLACCLATDVTTEILIAYFGGKSIQDINPILGRYYQHPRHFLDDKTFLASLARSVGAMYGVRWWRYAEGNRLAIP